MRRITDSIIRFSIYALVLVLPVFWLPFTVEGHEFNKQYLLFGLTGIAFVAWLLKMVIADKKIILKRTPLDIPILIIVVAAIASSVFSLDRTLSLLGTYGRYSDSLPNLICLVIIYFIIVNNLGSKEEMTPNPAGVGTLLRVKDVICAETLIRLVATSAMAVVLMSFFSLLGLWNKLPVPQTMKAQLFQPLSSSVDGLAVFIAVMIPAMIGLILTLTNKVWRGVVVAFIVLSVVLLAVINSKSVWVLLLLGSLVVTVLSLIDKRVRRQTNWLILPIIIVFCSAFYLSGAGAGLGLIGKNDLPREVVLDQSDSWHVTWETLKHYPILGSGMAAFSVVFSRFKAEAMNTERFWNVRFDKSASHIMDVISTTGVFGGVAYLFFLSLILLLTGLSVYRIKKGHLTDIAYLPILSGLVSLVLAQVFYSQNIVLGFLFWLFVALAVIAWQSRGLVADKKVEVDLRSMPEVNLAVNIITFVLVLVGLGAFYISGRFYYADIKFRNALNENESGEVVNDMESAVNLNEYRSDYRRELANAYLGVALTEFAKPEDQRNIELLQGLVSNAVKQAKMSVTLNPNLVSVWENLGMIYVNSRNLVNGTLPFAVDAYQKAIELESSNPVFYSEQCRLTLDEETVSWSETITNCQKAVDLKPNFLDAHVQLALAYERKGDSAEALKKMEVALDKMKGVSFQRGSSLANAAAEIYFQLGRLHFNLNQFEEAIVMLEQAVIVEPNHSNARYSLGMAYKTQERTNDAYTQFKITEELAPGNARIQEIIRDLAVQGAIDVRTGQP